MKTYVKRFKNGKISHYLRPVKLTTGKYATETRSYKKAEFETNINYPLFDSLPDTEKYLSIVFKETE